MIQFLRVTGRSLEPHYHEGDFVLILKIPFSLLSCRPGDVVVFHNNTYGTLIKRVDHLANDGRLYVLGSDPDSTDSRVFGTISPRDVTGKVIWHVRKPVDPGRTGPGRRE
jgi:signal peptidase I